MYGRTNAREREPTASPTTCRRLVGRFGGNLTRRNCCAGPGSKVDAPELSSGPGWEIQEVSRAGAQRVTSKSKLLALEMPRVCSRGLRVDSGEIVAEGWLRGARLQSRCAGALLGTRMGDTGGKSGRRPGRHLQVEASGPGNAASVQQRLVCVGRFRGGEIAPGRTCAAWLKVDAPELSTGPVGEI